MSGMADYYGINDNSNFINVYDEMIFDSDTVAEEYAVAVDGESSGNAQESSKNDSESGAASQKGEDKGLNPLCCMNGSIEFEQNDSEGIDAELYLTKEWGMGEQDGYVHIGIARLQELVSH